MLTSHSRRSLSFLASLAPTCSSLPLCSFRSRSPGRISLLIGDRRTSRLLNERAGPSVTRPATRLAHGGTRTISRRRRRHPVLPRPLLAAWRVSARL